MRKIVFAVLTLMALFTASNTAEATGPNVGKGCVASWDTVNPVGGGTVTYNLYIAPGTPSLPPTIPAWKGVTGLAANPCTNLAGGQYSAWVSAVETFGGSASEGAISAPFPFVVAVPGVPANLQVR